MVMDYQLFRTMEEQEIEFGATAKPLSQAMSFNVVEKS